VLNFKEIGMIMTKITELNKIDKKIIPIFCSEIVVFAKQIVPGSHPARVSGKYIWADGTRYSLGRQPI